MAIFLLAWWNADTCGGFDLSDLWGVDAPIATDTAMVFALLCRSRHYPHAFGYRRHHEIVTGLGRPAAE